MARECSQETAKDHACSHCCVKYVQVAQNINMSAVMSRCKLTLISTGNSMNAITKVGQIIPVAMIFGNNRRE